MVDRLKVAWQEGRGAINGWLTLPDAVTAEFLANQDFDSLTIDMQHGLIDYQTTLHVLQAVTSGHTTPMVRVPWLEPGLIMKVLDAGAMGVICPMINSREEAESLVRHCLYPPIGNRSYGPTRAALIYGRDYFSRANDSVVVMPMIETREAFENVNDISATPGVTGIYVGPSDLGVSFGLSPRFDHDDTAMTTRIETILQAAKEHGIRAGIHCVSPSYAKEMLALGFDLVTVGSDIHWLMKAVSGAIKQVRSQGPD